MVRKILFTVVLLLISIGSLSAQEKSLERANAKYDEFSFSPAIDI